ncbi:ribonuclease 8-like [Sorex araneus]|uniref:ribonuclease 8-like n=1 Tax=Sorex araneus TaxID=42254 RepID=UPI00243408E1|nr:ribonuclease 8-like [Sorex araneus]
MPPREMAPTRTRSCPLLLLLLLALWVAQHPVSAKPKNMTSAQWFETQHVQLSPKRCNMAMRPINQDKKRCKNLNTFLHEPFSSVANTCQIPNIACKNGWDNCHQSPEPVSLTNCHLVSGMYPDCNYKDKQGQMNASFIIACDPPEERDPWKLPLLPVHLDKVI